MTDLLSWTKFYDDYKKRKNSPISFVGPFNRLIAYSNNFFCIVGYGAFVEGYYLVLTKELLPSFAFIKPSKIIELNNFIGFLKQMIKKLYNKDCAVFEHGLCSCVGGLDRAHLHLMPINPNLNFSIFKKKTNKVLKDRCAGIEEITYLNAKISHPHDIKHILKEVSKEKIKIKGKILKYNDLKDLNISKWPLKINNNKNLGQTYIFFDGGDEKKSFLTLKKIETQLGRQIVLEIELETNKKLKQIYQKNYMKNPYSNLWRWQEFRFDNNILRTLDKTKEYFKKNKKILRNFKIKNAI